MAKSKRLREKTKSKTVYASAKKRTEEHDSGFQSTSFKIPEGFKKFKFKKGNNRINVMPFVAGKGNPFADEGIAHYERTYFVHKNVGPEQQSYCCLRKTFNKACPICEHTAKLRRAPNADNDAIRAMEPKERQIFCFEDAKEPDAGFQIYECSHFKGFGQLLDNKVKSSEDDDNYENFFHLEDGLTLKVFATEEKFNGRTYMSPSSIEMIERKEDFDEDTIEKIPCLDDCLIELSYKELKKIFTAGSSDDDTDESDGDDEPKPKSKGKSKTKPVDDDEDEEETEDEEDADTEDEEEEESDAINVGDVVTWKYKGKKMEGEVTKINEKKKLATVTVEGKEMPSIVDLADLTIVEDTDEPEDEEEDEDPKPKKGKKPSKKEDDDDEEEESEESEEDDDADESETEDDDAESDADTDDDGDDEEEEEEDVKPAKKGKAKKKDEEEEDTDDDEPWDDDADSDDDEEEEEEEEEPAPKPKKKKK